MNGGKSFKSPGGLVADLDMASHDRLADSKVLASSGRAASAIACGLYALEIRLKVLICEKLDLSSLPRPFEIHDLEALLLLAGLSQKINDPAAVNVRINWGNILAFPATLNELRYTPDRNWSPLQVSTFMSWLEDPTDGVLPWLLRQN